MAHTVGFVDISPISSHVDPTIVPKSDAFQGIPYWLHEVVHVRDPLFGIMSDAEFNLIRERALIDGPHRQGCQVDVQLPLIEPLTVVRLSGHWPGVHTKLEIRLSAVVWSISVDRLSGHSSGSHRISRASER